MDEVRVFCALSRSLCSNANMELLDAMFDECNGVQPCVGNDSFLQAKVHVVPREVERSIENDRHKCAKKDECHPRLAAQRTERLPA